MTLMDFGSCCSVTDFRWIDTCKRFLLFYYVRIQYLNSCFNTQFCGWKHCSSIYYSQYQFVCYCFLLGIGITTRGEVYFNGNSYLTYNAGRNLLAGLENSVTVTFTLLQQQRNTSLQGWFRGVLRFGYPYQKGLPGMENNFWNSWGRCINISKQINNLCHMTLRLREYI